MQADQYAAVIHASADDVVNHALEYVFSKDRDFQEFLKSADAALQSALSAVRLLIDLEGFETIRGALRRCRFT